jgi:hypothetical protein
MFTDFYSIVRREIKEYKQVPEDKKSEECKEEYKDNCIGLFLNTVHILVLVIQFIVISYLILQRLF